MYGRNKILAISEFPLPVITYGFGRYSMAVHRPGAALSKDKKAPLYARCPPSFCRRRSTVRSLQ